MTQQFAATVELIRAFLVTNVEVFLELAGVSSDLGIIVDDALGV